MYQDIKQYLSEDLNLILEELPESSGDHVCIGVIYEAFSEKSILDFARIMSETYGFFKFTTYLELPTKVELHGDNRFMMTFRFNVPEGFTKENLMAWNTENDWYFLDDETEIKTRVIL
jgi:hypothetical protein